MHRKSFQKGSVMRSTDGRYWLGKYRERDGDKVTSRTKSLGRLDKMSKSEAKEKLANILRPVNVAVAGPLASTVKRFLQDVYLPCYAKRWKRSTLQTNTDRIQRDIVGPFGDREISSLTRQELQDCLDSKAGLSFSTVDHLKWDFHQMFEMACAEGLVVRNPALMLFTPRQCRKPERRVLTVEQIKLVFASLPLRERLQVKLAILASMRPGEIFALRRGGVVEKVAAIQERIYRGDLDTPKTEKSVREVPLSSGVMKDLKEWLSVSPDTGPGGWLFTSEKLTTPLSKDNAMERYIRPRLKRVGLGWCNFQIMRRTLPSYTTGRFNPKVVADLMGHDVNVNLNVYTQTSLESRREVVEALSALFD